MATQNSRAEYFRERRSKIRRFTVEVDSDKLDMLESALKKTGVSKKQWFDDLLSKEFGKEK